MIKNINTKILFFICLFLLANSSCAYKKANVLDWVLGAKYIDNLRAHKYSFSPIEKSKIFKKEKKFICYTVYYKSEGLKISGLLFEPTRKQKKLKTILLFHGYYQPESYKQGMGTYKIAKELAERNFLVFVPDYREYGLSEGKITYDIPGGEYDCINAVNAISTYEKCDTTDIGIAGYSWGGGFALKTAMVKNNIKYLCLFYASYGGTFFRKNEIAYFRHLKATDEMITDAFKKISVLYNLNYIACPVMIFHGKKDTTVNYHFSQILYKQFLYFKKKSELKLYDKVNHGYAEWPLKSPSFKTFINFINKNFD